MFTVRPGWTYLYSSLPPPSSSRPNPLSFQQQLFRPVLFDEPQRIRVLSPNPYLPRISAHGVAQCLMSTFVLYARPPLPSCVANAEQVFAVKAPQGGRQPQRHPAGYRRAHGGAGDQRGGRAEAGGHDPGPLRDLQARESGFGALSAVMPLGTCVVSRCSCFVLFRPPPPPVFPHLT